MTVRREMPYKEGIYFITFTCYEWMPLIELADAYDAVYHQFDILKLEGHYVLGFVIMPNHVHALLGMRDKGKSINKRIGTLKRFLGTTWYNDYRSQKKPMYWKNYQGEYLLRIETAVNCTRYLNPVLIVRNALAKK